MSCGKCANLRPTRQLRTGRPPVRESQKSLFTVRRKFRRFGWLLESNMATYGYIRADTLSDDKARQALTARLAAKAVALGGRLDTLFLGDGRHGTAETTAALNPGDTLIVLGLEHLGESMADLAANIKALCIRGVRLYAAGGTGTDLDLPPEAGAMLLKIVSLWRKTERAIRSRRSRETARRRKAQGLAVGYPPLGKRIVRRGGVARVEWDQRQLRHIAEIAQRVPVEGVATVARDFWRRGIKDRRGLPWGRQKPELFSVYRTPYASFHRAIRAFWRWKWSGELPEPYGTLAESLSEPRTFRARAAAKGLDGRRHGTAGARAGGAKGGAEGTPESSICVGNPATPPKGLLTMACRLLHWAFGSPLDPPPA